ncbi:S1-like domain-containing RNA-binding protein [Neptuniibacter sp.]|uniref:CvfB family protein n=1 Tax=Neptuniibacter sp. TaxID=1962643 RepID=UPI00261BB8A8|nr:S1-like domain-containing RNA-binding protein [Neptuniibacter sp.]MCP4596670.1 GntR family transcriptional regulator [Neptuniibacter sp.]
MAEIGKYNTLEVTRKKDFGVYLDAGELGEILLPKRYCPEDLEIGDSIRVFVHLDTEDYLIATTEKPYAIVDEFAMLKVTAVNDVGAFLDWGLSKDVLLPFSEQRQRPVEVGKRYLVRLYIDKNTNRIVASTKIDKFLDNTPPRYKQGEEVQLVIANRTDLGQKAIVNHQHWGMLFKSDLLKTVYPGQKFKGYIKEVRPDGKINLSMQKQGYGKVVDTAGEILNMLNEQDGYITINDKSSPELIYKYFGISKKAFKMAVGALLKQGKITTEPGGIRLKD